MQRIALNDIARLDFNLATTFVAIWEERSVSRAAARLRLSQSAVSGALARLRRAVGDPLFVRTRAAMEPTPRAIEIADALQRALPMLASALMPGGTFDPAAVSRPFSIGMSDDYLLASGPAIARRIAERAPRSSAIFRQCNAQTVEAMLEGREIDVALVAAPNAASRIMLHATIGRSGYCCLADPAALSDRLPLSLEAYLRLPHILVSYSGRSGIVDTALAGLARERRVAAALTQFAALPAFLSGAACVATLPAHAAQALAAITTLATFPAPLDLGAFDVALAWRRDMDADAANLWVRSVIEEAWRAQTRAP